MKITSISFTRTILLVLCLTLVSIYSGCGRNTRQVDTLPAVSSTSSQTQVYPFPNSVKSPLVIAQESSPLDSESRPSSAVEVSGILFQELEGSDVEIGETILVSHSIPLTLSAWGIALDDEYVYWVDDVEPERIKRVSQKFPQEPEVVAEGSYTQPNVEGVVSNFQISGDQQWLVYADRSTQYIGGLWKITALDIESGEKKILLENDGSPFESQTIPTLQNVWLDTGDANVVLTYLLEATAEGCQRAVTRIVELKTLESRVISETDCAKNAELLLWPSLDGDYLAVEKDYHDEEGGGIDIALYNLKTGEEQRITEDRGSVQPQVSSQYVVWKRAHRSDFSQSLGIYDIRTRQTTYLELPVELPRPNLDGEWLYWYPAPRELFYAYHIPTGHLELLANPTGCNTGIYAVAMRDNMAAWVRAVDARSSLETVLEWRAVGTNPESNKPLIVCWEEHSQSLGATEP